jgi:site-specific DNA-cytosine methylase
MLKVVELFAGVGGFRIGLEATKKFEVIWSNQWEPSTKAQHASWVYENRFGDKGHSNENIEELGIKERTVFKKLKKYVDDGLIQKKSLGKYKKNQLNY